MALIRANTSGGGSGKIPFTLNNSIYSTRATMSAQDCYIYDDNGTIKVHVDVTFTTLTYLGAGYYLIYNFPVIATKDFTIDSTWKLENYYSQSTQGGMYLCSPNAVSANQTYHLVFDYTMEYLR